MREQSYLDKYKYHLPGSTSTKFDTFGFDNFVRTSKHLIYCNFRKYFYKCVIVYNDFIYFF